MESHTFTAAVRGYHYYRRFWRPKENEKLIWLYEAENPFDRFAIKTVNESGEILGHLPKEISRVTKYFLDRGASMYCKLSSEHYRRSPFARGLEIECEVLINSRATMFQSRLTARYLDLVKDLYTEPAVFWKPTQFCHDITPMVNTPAPVKRKKKAVAIIINLFIVDKIYNSSTHNSCKNIYI